MKVILLALLALVLARPLPAQPAEGKLYQALAQLKTNGPTTFADLLYGIDTESARLLANQLKPLIGPSGDYLGYQVVSKIALTTRVERLTLAIYFERLPVYMRIDVYENPSGKIYLPAKVSRDAADILPFDLISAAGK